MLDADEILNGLLRGALSGRRKSWRRTGAAIGGGLINTQTLLAAAGVAWGLYETWQQQQARPQRAVSDSPPPPGPVPPSVVPPPSDEDALPPAIVQLLRLMISAARADGEIGPAERERILAEAREVGAEAEVERELATTRPLAAIVAGVEDREASEQLYALAFTIVRADEAVTGGERIYLARLAQLLGLDAAAVGRLEQTVAARIDTKRAATP